MESLPDSDDQASRNSSLRRAILLHPIEKVNFIFHANRISACGKRDGESHYGFAPSRNDESVALLIFVKIWSKRVKQ
ncbi:hypothetical protein D3C81_1852340 [compost metagenome]